MSLDRLVWMKSGNKLECLTLTFRVPFELLVEWVRLCWVGTSDDVDDDDDVVLSFTYSKFPKCGVVCDFDGC